MTKVRLEGPPGRGRRQRRRVSALALFAVMATGSVTACGSAQTANRAVYALEAENDGGWCLPEGQLAISGMQVAKAVYDPITMPNAKGEFVPWLAKTVDHNATFDTWTITLRSGIKFHDGSPLTAEVVKNNLDAYRGAYPKRKPLLFIFVLQNIKAVTVTGPLTVQVTTNTPWPAFPAYLNANNRFGVMAQAQLDDPTNCADHLIGTGPFQMNQTGTEWKKDWVPNDHLTLHKNKNYWLKGYPKLDEIEFRPIADTAVRNNALQAGEVDLIHTPDLLSIENFKKQASQGSVNLYTTDKFAEVTYVMPNNSKAPFNNECARLALAHAADRDLINRIINGGFAKVANSPFPPGTIGHLDAKQAGFPEYSPTKAREYLKRYKDGDPTCPVQCPKDDPTTPAKEDEPCRKEARAKKSKLEFTLSVTSDPAVQAVGKLLQALGARYGVRITLDPVEQAQLVNRAISGDFQASVFRNHPGGLPDQQYVWFASGPTNFARFDNPEMQALWVKGRGISDPAEQAKVYEQITKVFAAHALDIWAWYARWGIVSDTRIGGSIIGPPLPDGSAAFPGLATGHSLLDLCVKGVSCD